MIQSPSTMHGSRGGRWRGILISRIYPVKLRKIYLGILLANLNIPWNPLHFRKKNSGCVPEQTYETPSYHCRNFLRYLILCSKTIMTNTDITSAKHCNVRYFLHVNTVFAFFYQEVDNEMEFKP